MKTLSNKLGDVLIEVAVLMSFFEDKNAEIGGKFDEASAELLGAGVYLRDGLIKLDLVENHPGELINDTVMQEICDGINNIRDALQQLKETI